MSKPLPPLPTGSVDVSLLHAALDAGADPVEAMAAAVVRKDAPEPEPAPAGKAAKATPKTEAPTSDADGSA